MPEGEMQRDEVASDSGNGRPEFSPAALGRLDKTCGDFSHNLTQTAIKCAVKDKCEVVQEKHIDQAEGVVCRMGSRDSSLSVNPHVWWLLAGVSFAVALAIPDAGAMLFGEPNNGWIWFVAKSLFFILLLCGFAFSVIAFLVALGPNKPRWVVASLEALGRIAHRD